jgi:hypothetical protein
MSSTEERPYEVSMRIYPSTEAVNGEGERSNWTPEDIKRFVKQFKYGEIAGPINLLREHGDEKQIGQQYRELLSSKRGDLCSHRSNDSRDGDASSNMPEICLGQMTKFHYNEVDGWLWGTADVKDEKIAREIKESGNLDRVSFSYLLWQEKGKLKQEAVEVSLTKDPDFVKAKVVACQSKDRNLPLPKVLKCHNSDSTAMLIWPVRIGPTCKSLLSTGQLQRRPYSTTTKDTPECHSYSPSTVPDASNNNATNSSKQNQVHRDQTHKNSNNIFNPTYSNSTYYLNLLKQRPTFNSNNTDISRALLQHHKQQTPNMEGASSSQPTSQALASESRSQQRTPLMPSSSAADNNFSSASPEETARGDGQQSEPSLLPGSHGTLAQERIRELEQKIASYERKEMQQKERKQTERLEKVADTVNTIVELLPKDIIQDEEKAFEAKKLLAQKAAKPGNEFIAASLEAAVLSTRQEQQKRKALEEQVRILSERYNALSQKRNDEEEQYTALIGSGMTTGLDYVTAPQFTSSQPQMLQHSKRARTSGFQAGEQADIFDRLFRQTPKQNNLSGQSGRATEPLYDQIKVPDTATLLQHSKGSGQSSSVYGSATGHSHSSSSSSSSSSSYSKGGLSLDPLVGKHYPAKRDAYGRVLVQHSSEGQHKARLDECTDKHGYNPFHQLYPYLLGQRPFDEHESDLETPHKGKGNPMLVRHSRGQSTKGVPGDKITDEDEERLRQERWSISQGVIADIARGKTEEYGDLPPDFFNNNLAKTSPELFSFIASEDIHSLETDTNQSANIKGVDQDGYNQSAMTRSRNTTRFSAIPQSLRGLNRDEASAFNQRVLYHIKPSVVEDNCGEGEEDFRQIASTYK